jgi:hypothetical protein
MTSHSRRSEFRAWAQTEPSWRETLLSVVLLAGLALAGWSVGVRRAALISTITVLIVPVTFSLYLLLRRPRKRGAAIDGPPGKPKSRAAGGAG